MPAPSQQKSSDSMSVLVGAWAADTNARGPYTCEVVTTSSRGKRRVIARIAGKPGTRELITHLIAAAPEMRDALTQLRETVLWHLTRAGTSAADAGLLGVIQDAEAALAKAQVPA